ncbi:histidine phosphatase family protein [Pusillimonas sp. TS35]|nr:histidine phosphatase family protein [Pusillimonas sp. TS35]
MLRLMLLRHAKSDRLEGIADHERPLASRGVRQGEAMGKYMATHGLTPDLALVSTARRAQETWALVAPAFGAAIPRIDEPRIYDASTADLLHVIHDITAGAHTAILVGHNPGFEQLATTLAGSGQPHAMSRLSREYPTAGLAVLDFKIANWRDVAARGGYLERFETLGTISG